MTPKDLNLIEYIKDMMQVGVNSFKVEGRMRGIYYIATVILTYRKIIDQIKANNLRESDINYYLDILNRCANRESTPQFVNKLPSKDEQYFLVILEQRNYFKVGDIVEFFGPDLETFSYQIDEIWNENDEQIEIANHPRMIVKLKIKTILKKYDMMRIKVFDKQDYL